MKCTAVRLKKSHTFLLYILSLKFLILRVGSLYVVWLTVCCMTYGPKPVDGLQLFIQLHHEDDEEDDGEDHLANGHR